MRWTPKSLVFQSPFVRENTDGNRSSATYLWYAWRPVKTQEGKRVWLEWVQRVDDTNGYTGALWSMYWLYDVAPPKENKE